MSEDSDFVKRIASRFSAQALRASTPAVAKDSTDIAARLVSIADELDRLKDLTTAIPRSLGKVSDLPASLLAELSSVSADELEDQIVTVINAYDGVANIDEILVGLYRKFKVEQTRKFLLNKLYRMMRSALLYNVPGRKGLYSTKAPPEGAATEPEEDEEIPWEVEPAKRKRKAEEDFSRPDFDDEIPF